MANRGNILSSIDWLTIGLYLIMIFFGWVNIYGATYNFEQTSMVNLSNPAGKQFMWIGVSLVIAITILIIDYKTYDFFAYAIYIFWILVLIATPIIATKTHGDIKGSLSWIKIRTISFQPAEWAKFITALCLAKWMSRYDFKITDWRSMVVPLGIICIPMFIIMVLQKETGTALVFAAFFLVLYREGMSGYIIAGVIAFALLFIISIKYMPAALPLGSGNWGIILSCTGLYIVILTLILFKEYLKLQTIIIASVIAATYAISTLLSIWIKVNFTIVSACLIGCCIIFLIIEAIYLRRKSLIILSLFTILTAASCFSSSKIFSHLPDHQRKRVEVTLKMRQDPSGVEYNTIQAKIAIGSGGFTGKGYLHGTQTTLNFVPEQHTDFIFCTVGEEFGFIGTFGVLIVYLIFILRLIQLSERQKDMFSQIYGYSVTCIFIIHLIINIGMVLGLLPVIGIPLPFYSYGGSSLMGFTILLFIFIKLDSSRVEKL